MKSLAVSGQKNNFLGAIARIKAIQPSIIFFFAAPSLFRDGAFVGSLLSETKGLQLIGCSTSGEISDKGVLKDSFSILGIHFDKGSAVTASAQIADNNASYSAGEQIGEALKGPVLKSVIVFGPGTKINGSALVDGITARLGSNLMVSGGLAGDELAFKQTFTIINGEIFSDRAVAVGLYGDSVVVSCGSEGGWRPFGPARRVTKSDNNILYELDNKPALQLYKQYLGDKARTLPASGLSYPFAILRDDRSTSGIIRSALDIDHAHESLILAGTMPQGVRVCLMHADTAALTQGAAQAAAEALRTHAGPEENGCALLVSCVGRKNVLGIDVDDEIEAVVDSFLPATPISGYYSYGEICSYSGTGKSELHNQTMTITYITEKMGD